MTEETLQTVLSDALAGKLDEPGAGSESELHELLCPFSVGDAVVAVVGIYDDGEDHHPPGYLAKPGERLYVRGVSDATKSIGVSHHNVHDNYFWVHPDEIRQA